MATFYIKSAGGTGTGADDANAWSLAHFNSQTLVAGNSYLFKRGDTFSGSLTINASGTDSSRITFDYYGSGAKPIISGLTTITGWVSLGAGLYEKTLSSPPTNSLNVVLIDGVITGFGRLPKAGLGEASYFTVDSHTTANTSWTRSHGTLTSSEIAAAPSCVGGEICQRSEKWVLDRALVTSQSSTVVGYTSHSSPRHPTVTYEPVNGHGFFFQNHINCCTVLGEWAYNQTTKKITMFFGAEDPTDYVVQVSTVDNLLSSDNKNYVTVNNIEFNGANECCVLFANGSSYFTFNDCNIYNAGWHHILNQNNSAHHIIFDGNHLSTCNNNSMSVITGPSWTITNNIIEYIGTIMGMGLSGDGQYIGISAIGTNSLAQYNILRYLGYLGIHFRPEDNITIQENVVHDYCLVKDDGGGIYTFGAGGTNKLIHKNICYNGIGNNYGIGQDTSDIYPDGQIHGIYLDQDSANVEITDNTSFLNGHSGLLLGNNNQNITVTGNTLFDNEITQFKGSGGNDYSGIFMDNNIFFAKRTGSLCMTCLFPLDDIQAMTSDNNKLCRPLWEPQGVDSAGFGISPLTWSNYNDGGIVVAPNSSPKYKSLDVWKTYSGNEASSVGSPVTIQLENKIRFDYNATAAPVNIDLTTKFYIDLDGVAYSGDYDLEPYSSKILLEVETPGTVFYGKRAIVL